jgi:hypothetical protein
MTDSDKLKYIVENGTCHDDMICFDCIMNDKGPMSCLNKSDMMKNAKELLNELRTKKLERIIND